MRRTNQPPDPEARLFRKTFTYTGSQQTFIVPAGVTQVTITVAGAQPGAGNSGGAGGDGAVVTAVIPVASRLSPLLVAVRAPTVF
jgi:hypothetical protein